jgi:hypothetical protein
VEALSCQFCHKTYERSGARGPISKYCSKACRDAECNQIRRDQIGFHRADRHEDRTCVHCGGTFTVVLSSKQVRCSRECMKSDPVWRAKQLDRQRSATTGYLRLHPRVDRSATCPTCATSFTRRKNYMAQVYCSYQCAQQALWIGKVCRVEARTCTECGQAFAVHGLLQLAKTCGRVECQRHRCNRWGREKWGRNASIREVDNPVVARECKVCGAGFSTHAKSKRSYCSIRCANRSQGKAQNHRRRVHLRGGRFENVNRFDIYRRDGGRCWLCSKPISLELRSPHRMSFTLDHVVPVALGGHHVASNLRAAHFICNSLRGAKGSGQLVLLA